MSMVISCCQQAVAVSLSVSISASFSALLNVSVPMWELFNVKVADVLTV